MYYNIYIADWSKAFNQYTKAEEVDMITQYLQQTLHLSFGVQSLPSFQALTP